MKIVYFKIENFRNIRLAECTEPPDFVVICGGNGCGKSALLQALVTAKENAAPYGRFSADPRAVSADAENARIELRLSFSNIERTWYADTHRQECPPTDDIVIEIAKGGRARAIKQSVFIKNLLSFYSRNFENSPGFFDYIEAHREPLRKDLSTWNPTVLSDEQLKVNLTAPGREKFQFTKEYLASLKMADLQHLASSHRAGNPEFPDSLEEIRVFFNDFFAPMSFVDVQIDSSPFKFIIRTPRGDIDIDDMSGGEKEILNAFIRFHQLQPRDAVILFDEADAHLHPDLERRYLEVLRDIGKGNQVWLTTHSPEMMIGAGSKSLFTILKEPPPGGGNQFVQVTSNEDLHDSLSELMGSRGLVSFNQRIVFIEGTEASADRYVYEQFYPPGEFNVSFVPAGDSGSVRKTAERVNDLLTAAVGFQHYYAVVDGDLDRATEDPQNGRLFKLPVYHVENFLLDEQILLETLRDLLANKCPYEDVNSLTEELCTLLLEESHLLSFTKARLDARIAVLARQAYDAVYSSCEKDPEELTRPDFATVKKEAEGYLVDAIRDGTWKEKCKGRELLKALCHKNRIQYDSFRNLVVSRSKEPPKGLQLIMNQILGALVPKKKIESSVAQSVSG